MFFLKVNNSSISNVFTRLNETCGFQHQQISELLKLPLSITINRKLLAFQFKILNNLIATKVWLFRIHKVTFCNRSPETLVHLFFTCHITNKFWKDVSTLFAEFDLAFFSRRKCVLYGIYEPRKSRNIYLSNLLLLLGKHYIFSCRCSDTKPTPPLLQLCFVIRTY